MFPILPILILLLMGPANAERLAVEGRLPSALLAAHRAMVQPIRATVAAPVEQEALDGAERQKGRRPAVHPDAPVPPSTLDNGGFQPAAPSRAGPQVA